MTATEALTGRCGACGYRAADYASPRAVAWTRVALRERSKLAFEGVQRGAGIPGVGTYRELKAAVAALLEGDDLHPAMHLVERAVRTACAAVTTPSGRGTVAQVSSSEGGVPKLAIESATVTWRGLEGDCQRDGKHHGHAWQALCLWSAERIEALQHEGHPIGFGSAGENLTLRGVEWGTLRTGMRLEIGDTLCELTVPAVPCQNNARWFVAGNFLRMSHARHPGWSRWYASVLRPGGVRRGDAVILIETPPQAAELIDT